MPGAPNSRAVAAWDSQWLKITIPSRFRVTLAFATLALTIDQPPCPKGKGNCPLLRSPSGPQGAPFSDPFTLDCKRTFGGSAIHLKSQTTSLQPAALNVLPSTLRWFGAMRATPMLHFGSLLSSAHTKRQMQPTASGGIVQAPSLCKYLQDYIYPSDAET